MAVAVNSAGRPSGHIARPRVTGVFTVRNIGGVALVLFGTTYVWLTQALALLGIDTSALGTWGIDTSGLWWDVTRVLSAVTLVCFTVATVGLFARSSWWAVVAVASASLGLLALIPFWIAVEVAGGTTHGSTCSSTRSAVRGCSCFSWSHPRALG